METATKGRTTALIDYGIAAMAIAVDLVSTFLPRADKAGALRGDLRAVHMTVGMILFGLLAVRLWRWWRDDVPQVATTLRPMATAWILVLTGAVYILLFINPLFGASYGWTNAMLPWQSGGTHVVLDRALWLFTGYFHSATGFSILLAKLLIILTAAYTLLRYGKGLFAAFPRGIGLMTFLGFSNSLFAMSTFKSYDNGPWVVAGFWLLCLAVWGVARLIRRRSGDTVTASPARSHYALATAVAALVVSLGLYGPHAMFRVSPFERAATVSAPAGVTSHDAPALTEVLPPESDYERQVKAETFKWCTFCHTMNKGGAPIVGPNLYGIYGQRIATVPNFAYGARLAERGARGEVWDDKALDAFLANPDAFAPGTTMVISSGNITDPRRRAAIITILKRQTGSDASATTPPSSPAR